MKIEHSEAHRNWFTAMRTSRTAAVASLVTYMPLLALDLAGTVP